jgi:hypothetical protein
MPAAVHRDLLENFSFMMRSDVINVVHQRQLEQSWVPYTSPSDKLSDCPPRPRDKDKTASPFVTLS